MNRRPGLLFLSLCTTAACAQNPVTLERVEITGSRVPRIDAETALPVQVIDREEIERSGVQTVEELLDRVSANFGGQREASSVGSEAPGFSGVSLRGLGPGQTLVLLNGRRLANYAFSGLGSQGVDLHAIPLAALDRVEILKDGASAIYGSDAIAGVINFLTRKDYAGGDLSATYSAPQAGGAERTRMTMSAGRGDVRADGFNLFGVLDAQKTKRLRAIDRPLLATGYRPEFGLPLEALSSNSWPSNIIVQANGGIDLVNPAAPACTPFTVNVGRACWFDVQKAVDLVAPSQQASLFGRGTLRLTPDTEGYAEVLASVNRIEFRVAPSPAATPSGTIFVLPASSPYYPSGLGLSGDLDLLYRTLPLGERVSQVESTNARVLVGVKSSAANWDFDAALTLNDSRSKERYRSGYVDAGRLSAAIDTGLVNPFGPSGAEGNALLAASEVRGIARQAEGRTQSADLRASRELAQLANGPLTLATGIEARHEYLSDAQGATVADIAAVFPSAPKEGARDAQAAFVELVAPLARGLEVQAAARLDRYGDFGNYLSPKIAARLQPAPSWLVRASVGRGFRAPSLPELYTQQRTALFENSSLPFPFSDPVRCPITRLASDCMPSLFVTDGGNPALQPQRSTQASIGLVFERARAWLASIDFWAIRVRDTIDSLPFFQVASDIPSYEGRNVIRGPVEAAFPGLPGPIVRIVTTAENLGDRRITGTDLSLSLRPTSTPVGRFSASLDGTYVFHARQELVKGNGVDLMGRLTPRWQHMLALNLDRGPWTGTLSQRFRHGYDDAIPLPDGTTRRVASYVVWDGQIAYSVGPDTKILLGVRNLLDTPPPFTNNLFNFQVGYDPGYADPQGRTLTFGVRVAWH